MNQTSQLSDNCIDIRELYKNKTNDWTGYAPAVYAFGTLYSLVLAAGVMGNLCVILSVLRNDHLRSVRNFFLVNLSCSDTVVCMTSVILTPVTAFLKNWIFGKILCYVVPMFQCMSICISTFTLTCIAIDRYLLICRPERKPITSSGAFIMISLVWLISIGITIPLVAHMRIMIIPDVCGVFCSENWSSELARIAYGTVILIVQFLLPFSIMGYCYNRICARLNRGILVRRASSLSANHCALTNSEKRVLRRKCRTNRMLILMVIVFGSCWVLSVVQNLLRDAKALPKFIEEQEVFYHLVVHWISMTSTVWNPLLYAVFNWQFREAFKGLFPCYNPPPTTVSTRHYKDTQDIGRSTTFSPKKLSETDRLLSYSSRLCPSLSDMSSVSKTQWIQRRDTVTTVHSRNEMKMDDEMLEVAL